MKYKLNKAVYNNKIKAFKNKDSIRFHKYLSELLSLKANDKVLDLGCGQGQTLIHILKMIKKGKVRGFDLSEDSLAVAEKYLYKYINSGKLELEKGNIAEKLPFDKNFFDKIICHNVLECVPNKIKLINECFRILRKGGILIISHSDFDTQVFNSNYPKLNRSLIHNFADTTQGWMEVSDGMIGRKLAGIFQKTHFKNFKANICTITNLFFSPSNYGFGMAQSVASIGLKSSKFKEADIKKWLGDLKKMDRKGEYFFSININIITAEK